MDRNCPICQSENREIVTAFEGYDGIYHPAECEKCGFLFLIDPREETASRTLEAPNSIPSPKRRHYYITRLITNHIPKGSNVLEIGSGFGELGKLLEQFEYDYRGYEPSVKRADVAADGGLDVISDVYEFEGREYDTVILDNVLEHVTDPHSVFQDAAKSLSKNGIILTIVPNRYDVRRLYPPWNEENFFQSSHINYFRSIDLERLYNSAGISMTSFDRSTFGFEEKKDAAFWATSFITNRGVYPFGLYCYGKN